MRHVLAGFVSVGAGVESGRLGVAAVEDSGGGFIISSSSSSSSLQS